MADNSVERIEQWLAKALDAEKKSNELYLKSAEVAEDNFIKDLFNTLSQMGNCHLEAIQMSYDDIRKGPDVCWLQPEQMQGNPKRLDDFFSNIDKVKNTPQSAILEALDMAIDMESSISDFYNSEASIAGCQQEKEFLTRLAKNKRASREILAALKTYYDDPEAWLMEMENFSLEG